VTRTRPLETLVRNIKYVRSFLLADEKGDWTKNSQVEGRRRVRRGSASLEDIVGRTCCGRAKGEKDENRKREREREEGPEVRCFLGKQKSHIEMSLKSPRNPWPLSSPLSPRRQAVLNFSGMLEASKARSRDDIYPIKSANGINDVRTFRDDEMRTAATYSLPR